MTNARALLAIPALVLAAVSVTACSTSSSSCARGTCTVTLSGAGAETEIMDDTVTVTLVGASNGVAMYEVDGRSSSCAEGDDQRVAGFEVVCTDVGDNKLTLEIS
jgi:membrane protein implicated in regulation of membrane protease activity